MNGTPERASLWSFRLSLVCFALAWFLPVFSTNEGSLFLGAWTTYAAPIVAYGLWVTIAFDGFEPQILLWAVLFTFTTTMNGVLVLAPFLRETFAEHPWPIALSFGLSALAAAVLCHWPPGAEALLPVWGLVELAWIASFVLMSASGVAGCFAGVPSSTSQRFSNDDRSL